MSEQAHGDLCQEIDQQCQYPDPDDVLDAMYQQPQWLAQGYAREIELREGLELEIENYRLCDRWLLARPERKSWLMYHFHHKCLGWWALPIEVILLRCFERNLDSTLKSIGSNEKIPSSD